MAKKALIVGINDYDNFDPLKSCVSDAESIDAVLSSNDDGSPNFTGKLFTSTGKTRITKKFLKEKLVQLFKSFDGDVLFYFSGHGIVTNTGGCLVTQEGDDDDPGIRMDDLFKMARQSKAKTVLMILDCCSSGSLGSDSEELLALSEGITILAASRPEQDAMEVGGHGVFTRLLIGALRGGAADIRGRVSAASMYAYAEAALGSWDQRPIYKSHAATLEPVRRCTPQVEDSEIREMSAYFNDGKGNLVADYLLDETYEVTHSDAVPEKVAIFKALKRLQLAGLVRPTAGADLYFCAIGKAPRPVATLTELGKFYWELVKKRLI